MLGVVLVILGVYYLGAVLNASTWMYRYSVFGRFVAVVGIGYLAIVDGPVQLWIFVALDGLGASVDSSCAPATTDDSSRGGAGTGLRRR